MNNKSIISLISFFFLSMFYVASASAGSAGLVTVNVDMPKECGAWKQIDNKECRGETSGKAGHNTKFVCAGKGKGGRGGSVTIKFKSCKTVKIQTLRIGSVDRNGVQYYSAYALKGHVERFNHNKDVTIEVCKPGHWKYRGSVRGWGCSK